MSLFILLSTSYWPGLPAGGFRGHGVYHLEPAAAVAHDPAETGLRQVTVQSAGLTHVARRQSLFTDGVNQVLVLLRVIPGTAFEVEPINICYSERSSLQLLGSSRMDMSLVRQIYNTNICASLPRIIS